MLKSYFVKQWVSNNMEWLHYVILLLSKVEYMMMDMYTYSTHIPEYLFHEKSGNLGIQWFPNRVSLISSPPPLLANTVIVHVQWQLW